MAAEVNPDSYEVTLQSLFQSPLCWAVSCRCACMHGLHSYKTVVLGERTAVSQRSKSVDTYNIVSYICTYLYG